MLSACMLYYIMLCYLLGTSANSLLPNDFLICECFSVNAGDIRQYIGDKQLFTLDNLSKKFCMGTGCKSCINNKSDWFNKIFE